MGRVTGGGGSRRDEGRRARAVPRRVAGRAARRTAERAVRRRTVEVAEARAARAQTRGAAVTAVRLGRAVQRPSRVAVARAARPAWRGAAAGGTTGAAGRGGAAGGGTGGTTGTAGRGGTGGATPNGGTGGGTAGTGGTGGGTAGTGGTGTSNACPLDLIGFATLAGGTTGGGTAAPTTVRTQAELRTCATAAGPRVCRVQGTLTFSPFEEIRVASDKTIIGAGASAEIDCDGRLATSASTTSSSATGPSATASSKASTTTGWRREGRRSPRFQMDTAHHAYRFIDHVFVYSSRRRHDRQPQGQRPSSPCGGTSSAIHKRRSASAGPKTSPP